MEEDERYAGRVKKWEKEDDDDDEEDDSAAAAAAAEEEEDDEEGFSGVSDGEMEGGEDDEEEDEEEDDAISGEEDDDGFSQLMAPAADNDEEDETEREMRELREEEKAALEGISQVDDAELDQARGVQAQKRLWEDLLELRILAQKALATANQFPKPEAHAAFAAHSERAGQELLACQQEAAEMTRELRAVEAELVGANEEVSEACGAFGAGALESDNEEEEEAPDVESLWELLAADFGEHKPYREEMLEKWGRKAQLSRQFQLGNTILTPITLFKRQFQLGNTF